MPLNSLDKSPADLRVAKFQLHGVLVQVCDTGVLLIGESGSGKTATAIELVGRGHMFISDDAVEIHHEKGSAYGTSPEPTKALVHVRGFGILKADELFPRTAFRERCRVCLCIEIGGVGRANTAKVLDIPHFLIEMDLPGIMASKIETIVRNNSHVLTQ